MEINPIIAWYLFFALFAIGFIFVMWMRRETRYIFYFAFGSILGLFVFDLPSVILGYYKYSTDPLLIPVFGVPLTMAVAEGFAVAITIFIYEFLCGLRKKWARGDIRKH